MAGDPIVGVDVCTYPENIQIKEVSASYCINIKLTKPIEKRNLEEKLQVLKDDLLSIDYVGYIAYLISNKEPKVSIDVVLLDSNVLIMVIDKIKALDL